MNQMQQQIDRIEKMVNLLLQRPQQQQPPQQQQSSVKICSHKNIYKYIYKRI